MSRASKLGKGMAIAGATGAVATAAWAIQRARGRARTEPTSDDVVLRPISLAAATLPTHDRGTISYVDTGTDDVIAGTATVVLVHGVTLSMRTWVRQLDALPRAGLRVIAYDQRGHGASVLGESGFSVSNLGDDLAALLDGLGLDDVVLVGHSMGGIAVQSFVSRHPDEAREKVRSIVLLSTLAATLGGSQAAQFNALIERVLRRTPDSTRFWAVPRVGTMLARVGFGREPEESHVELVRQMIHECSPGTRIGGPRSLIGFDLTAELDRIDIPTIVVCGTKDVITPPSNARLLHERIAGSRLELLDGGGHMLMLERADFVNGVIEQAATTRRVAEAGDADGSLRGVS